MIYPPSALDDPDSEISRLLFVLEDMSSFSSTDDHERHNICKECSQNHSYKPNFHGIETSIDVLSQILIDKKNRNQRLEAA